MGAYEWQFERAVDDAISAAEQEPYIIKELVETRKVKIYNPAYGNDRVCVCGHPYYRHFDTYEEMRHVGCKYCDCCLFEEDEAN